MRHYRQNQQIYVLEPWWAEVSGTSDRLRYRRAERLSQMREQINRPAPKRQRPSVRVYRERCVAEWRYYLEHGEPPVELDHADAASERMIAR